MTDCCAGKESGGIQSREGRDVIVNDQGDFGAAKYDCVASLVLQDADRVDEVVSRDVAQVTVDEFVEDDVVYSDASVQVRYDGLDTNGVGRFRIHGAFHQEFGSRYPQSCEAA